MSSVLFHNIVWRDRLFVRKWSSSGYKRLIRIGGNNFSLKKSKIKNSMNVLQVERNKNQLDCAKVIAHRFLHLFSWTHINKFRWCPYKWSRIHCNCARCFVVNSDSVNVDRAIINYCYKCIGNSVESTGCLHTPLSNRNWNKYCLYVCFFDQFDLLKNSR